MLLSIWLVCGVRAPPLRATLFDEPSYLGNVTVELETLRDQHRAMRLSQNSMLLQIRELRERCSELETTVQEAEANATRMAHQLASERRLRIRATQECTTLRSRARDSSARVAELEAQLVTPKLVKEEPQSDDRALRIHTRRRQRMENATVAPAMPYPEPEQQQPLPVVLRAKKSVVLMPEYGLRPTARVDDHGELITSKLERGSALYQKVQMDHVKRRMGRDDSKRTTPDQILGESLFSTVPEPTIAPAIVAPRPVPLKPRPPAKVVNAKPVRPDDAETIVSKLRRGSSLYQQLQQNMVKQVLKPLVSRNNNAKTAPLTPVAASAGSDANASLA